MLFKLTNTPVNFQGYSNKIFAKKLNIIVVVSLDNIFIYINDNGNSYIAVICWALKQLEKFLLYASLKKYWFY